MLAPFPQNETERLAALGEHEILDTDPEPAFDRITALAARICGAPVALLSLVDRDRIWFKSRFGWDGREVSRAHAPCAEAILGSGVMVVPDVTRDERFRDSALSRVAAGIRSYAGAPVVCDGFALGTLCVFGRDPGGPGAVQVAQLAEMAAMAADALAVRRRLRAAEAACESFRAQIVEFEFTRSLMEEQAAQLVELAEDREDLFQSNIRNQRFIESLLNTIPIPIFARDETETITHANPAYAALFGLDLAAVRGSRTAEIFTPEHAKEVEEENRQLLLEPSGRSAREKRVAIGDDARDIVVHKAVIRGDDGSFQGIVGAIVDVTEQKALHTELERLATTDPLTGAANRRALTEKIDSELRRRAGRGLALVMLDIDRFKTVNDTFGHQAGDEVLKRVAAVCRDTIRASVDMLARLGGEEFVVVACDTDGPGGAALAERLRRRLEQQVVEHEGRQIRFTSSFGVAVAGPGAQADADDLLRRADECLYLSKHNGRNRVTVEDALLTPAA